MVKRLQELADEGILFKAAESELVKQNLFAIIKEEADATPVGRQVVDVMNMQYGSTLDIILADDDSMDVRVVAEGAEVPIDMEAYTKLQVTPAKYGVRLGITERMIEDSNWDLIERNLKTAGRKMALKEDAIIFDAMGDSTNGFPSQTGHGYTSAGTEIAIADIVGMMKHIEEHDYNPDTFLLHPEQVSELRQIDTFVEADKVGDRRVFERGWVGRIFGLDTIITTKVGASTGYMFEKSEAAGLVMRRPLTIKKLEDPIRDLTHAIVTQRMAAVCFRPKSGVKLTVS